MAGDEYANFGLRWNEIYPKIMGQLKKKKVRRLLNLYLRWKFPLILLPEKNFPNYLTMD
jgi:hypothetical protein